MRVKFVPETNNKNASALRKQRTLAEKSVPRVMAVPNVHSYKAWKNVWRSKMRHEHTNVVSSWNDLDSISILHANIVVTVHG